MEPKVQIRVYSRALFEAEIQAIYAGLIKPLRCRRCNLWFTSRSELMKHIWEVHRRQTKERLDGGDGNGD